MFRIGVVASDIRGDWPSNQLLKAVCDLAVGSAVDPMTFQLAAGIDGDARIHIRGEPAEVYDAYIIRSLNKRGEIDYQYEVLELLQRRGALVINSPCALSVAESKAQTTFLLREAGLPVPRTAVTQDVKEARSIVEAVGTAVLKPLYGSRGVGVELVSSDVSAELVSAFLDGYGAVYIQEYIPNEGRDIRAFVVGDDIPAAVYRVAADGQWKTNVAQGSKCQMCSLAPQLRELCIEAARAVGLDYTGVDIIEGPDGPLIIELNGAPSWYGLSNATNHNLAVDIVSHVLQKLARGQSARQPAEFRPL